MRKVKYNKYYSDAELEPFDGEKKNIADKVIRLYMYGKVSEEILQEFLVWLADESQSDEKDAALFRLWNRIGKRANRSTFVSWRKIAFKINGFPHKRVLSPGTIFLRTAAVMLPFIVMAGAYFWFNRQEISTETATPVARIEIRTPNGQFENVTLPDGSTVCLKGGSRLEYDEVFGETRGASLDGEAYFDIAGSQVPFVVTSSRSTVKVLGTKFNIEDYQTDNGVIVSLHSGALETTVGGNTYAMNTGDELCYDHASAGVTMRKLHNNYELSGNILSFNRNDLHDIFRKVERYFGCTVTVDGVVTDKNVYSTHFGEGESIERVMTVLQILADSFVYEIEGNSVMVKVK